MALRISPRFSLRTLLVVTAVAGIVLGVAARVHSRGQRQTQIVAAASAVGGYVRYDFECHSESSWYAAQRWLAPRIGGDYVGQVLILNYRTTASPELRASLTAASELTSIEYFSVCCHDLQQGDIEQIARLPALKEFGVMHVFNLPGLAPVAKLEHLEKLGLNSCNNVTSEKLQLLRSLPKLRLIDLCCSDAGDEIVPLLATFPALEELHVESSSITTAGLAGLKDSRSLRLLHVDDSQKDVQKSLPGVEVSVK